MKPTGQYPSFCLSPSIEEQCTRCFVESENTLIDVAAKGLQMITSFIDVDRFARNCFIQKPKLLPWCPNYAPQPQCDAWLGWRALGWGSEPSRATVRGCWSSRLHLPASSFSSSSPSSVLQKCWVALGKPSLDQAPPRRPETQGMFGYLSDIHSTFMNGRW